MGWEGSGEFILFLLLFEIVSCYVAQADLDFTAPPSLVLPCSAYWGVLTSW